MDSQERIAWLKEAKFGMFIHWGLYSLLAGEYKGEQVKGIAEWIMYRFHIPVSEYGKLKEQFSAEKFCAKDWASMAKNAGMKYMVFTAKHHDGFCMYDSKISDYNIMHTPFGRDAVLELSEECQRQGIRFGCYYSQVQDWFEPDAVGNDWDFDAQKKDFQRYLDNKVKPQLKELIEKYHISLIWFDTPFDITKEQSMQLERFVHDLDPACVISSRIGNDIGDYIGFGDNEFPAKNYPNFWESIGTMNESWGYKKADHFWKSSGDIIKILIDIVSKNGMYLLNVGPMPDGSFPKESVEILKDLNKFISVYHEAIYGAGENPFDREFDWGAITQKGEKLYLFLYENRKSLQLYGIQSEVISVKGLRSKEELPFVYKKEKGIGYLCIDTSSLSAEPVDVVCLEFENKPEICTDFEQDPDGKVILIPDRAEIVHKQSEKKLENEQQSFEMRAEVYRENAAEIGISKCGILENWKDEKDYLIWHSVRVKKGRYRVYLTTLIERPYLWLGETEGFWEGGQDLVLNGDGKDYSFSLSCGEIIRNSRCLNYKRMRSDSGIVVDLNQDKIIEIKLSAKNLNVQRFGLRLVDLRLEPHD